MTDRKMQRRANGNMLWFTLLGFLLLIIGLLVGASFINLLFVQSQVQKLTDEAGLRGAIKLNENNRIGQMNELIARCRQLVFTSRQITYAVPNTTPDLQTLSQQLLDEDRDSAVKLEIERSRLQAVSSNECKKAIGDSLENQKGIYRGLLPWLRIETPRLITIEFGSIKGVTSNAALNPVLDDLVAHDKTMRFYDPTSKLYFGNINAKLPDDDNDLTFNLSSLPAPVNGTISPARLTLADVFEKLKSQQLPSAAKLTAGAQVATVSLGAPQSHGVEVVSTATTNGATPIR